MDYQVLTALRKGYKDLIRRGLNEEKKIKINKLIIKKEGDYEILETGVFCRGKFIPYDKIQSLEFI